MREYLEVMRKSKGLTQKAVADAVGISQAYYNQIENGKRGGRMMIDVFAKLASALGLTLGEMMSAEQKWKEATQNGTTKKPS